MKSKRKIAEAIYDRLASKKVKKKVEESDSSSGGFRVSIIIMKSLVMERM